MRNDSNVMFYSVSICSLTCTSILYFEIHPRRLRAESGLFCNCFLATRRFICTGFLRPSEVSVDSSLDFRGETGVLLSSHSDVPGGIHVLASDFARGSYSSSSGSYGEKVIGVRHRIQYPAEEIVR